MQSLNSRQLRLFLAFIVAFLPRSIQTQFPASFLLDDL